MYKTLFILRWFGDSSNHFIENIHSNMLEYVHTLVLSQSWIELKTKVRTCRYLTLNVWTMTNCKVCWCPDLLCIMQPFASTNTCSQFFTHSTFLSLGSLLVIAFFLLTPLYPSLYHHRILLCCCSVEINKNSADYCLFVSTQSYAQYVAEAVYIQHQDVFRTWYLIQTFIRNTLDKLKLDF